MPALGPVDSQHARNICIVAHVDHGKSSFADCLLASNGIISTRLAGTIRYLDSREDEQERGITMESSAVSLGWRIPVTAQDGSQPRLEEYRVNLIDTPGHVDFSSEVNTASRLCDGALVLVDAVEGVCTQTVTVLRTVYFSHLKPILVINKLDRLVLELKLSPIEAYHHLSRIIEDVNAIVGSFYAGDRMEEDYRRKTKEEADKTDGDEDPFEERDDSSLYFDPALGNVIFASAVDGWGFRVSRFAQLYATKLGMKEDSLNKVLWGDWHLDAKSKRVLSKKKLEAQGKKGKPLFVQFVLDNIWAVYDSIIVKHDQAKIDKIIAALDLKIKPADLRSKDTRNLLLAVFAQWLPLPSAAFRAIIDRIPPPPEAQATRIPRLLHPELGLDAPLEPSTPLEKDLYTANDSSSAHTVAYVSKMFAVQTKDLPEHQRKQLTADDLRARAKAVREARERRKQLEQSGTSSEANGISLDEAQNADSAPEVKEDDEPETVEGETLLGFARLLSGSISVGEKLHAVLPRYIDTLPPSSRANAKSLATIEVQALYVMMGRELVAVDKVSAGHLCAVRGLEGVVLRNATLCKMGEREPKDSPAQADEDKEALINLAGVESAAAPIVRVALEPQEPFEMPKLVEGLKLLAQADPCVETLVQETGEHVILTAGELHLERCLKDLRDRFSKIEITVSPPIVPFRETAVHGVDMAPPRVGPRGTVQGSLQNGLLTFTVRALPMPAGLTSFLNSNSSTLRYLQRDRRSAGRDDVPAADVANEGEAKEDEDTVKPDKFWERLDELCKKSGRDWSNVAHQIWAFGPKRVGPNLLVTVKDDHTARRSLKTRLDKASAIPSGLMSREGAATTSQEAVASGELEKQLNEVKLQDEDDNTGTTTAQEMPDVRELDENFDTAFQLATQKGPLCAEPMSGLAFFLTDVSLHPGDLTVEQVRSKWTSMRGSLISSAADAFRQAMLDWSPRLQLAMYSCDIQATSEVLGKVYGVVSKRKGRIVSEEMKEGTTFFMVRALLPVVESFGFADEIRTRTSGAASPQLVFYGFETLDLDPFWVPKTEEELEDLGEKADRENLALRYMNAVRSRKGMAVERKAVEHAEKQKTLKR